jgi:hypothetical protein
MINLCILILAITCAFLYHIIIRSIHDSNRIFLNIKETIDLQNQVIDKLIKSHGRKFNDK